ncbi:hypothetical protein SAMN02745664_11547 [Moraxella cuniculi DSM 21768]|uniref:Lipoprotein n=1 Tax=Moraxella cuniculi DSM 21768 TaxID=1122245 RepID=A0A1N7FPI5_9GAMM|nr:hypothetical protein [Moraxella cuniculi]OOS07181.1 hypothetical protein B0189_03910 [Moraxella cuniculi]SIS02272.1 hypothetical protein SAMN02745664_11547 [Moraxella cuniculi DSM 21768]
MKRFKLATLATIIALSGCASTDPTQVGTTANNIGMGIVQSAVKQSCQNQLNKNQYWKIASVAMTQETQAKVSDTVCGCVADKAPKTVSLAEVATAAIDPAARTQVAQKVVVGSLQACMSDTLSSFLNK